MPEMVTMQAAFKFIDDGFNHAPTTEWILFNWIKKPLLHVFSHRCYKFQFIFFSIFNIL